MMAKTKNPFTGAKSRLRAQEEVEQVLAMMEKWDGKSHDEIKYYELFLV